MNDLQGFNANDHNEPSDMDFSVPMPAADYLVELVNTEVMESKSNAQNKYIAAEFSVIDGEFKGRRIWENFNMINTNHKAVKIAEELMGSLCRSVGIPTPRNGTKDLYNIPTIASVKIEKQKGDFPEKNKITKFTAPNKAYSKPQPKEEKTEEAKPSQPAWMS